jgi:hypothetical protein
MLRPESVDLSKESFEILHDCMRYSDPHKLHPHANSSKKNMISDMPPASRGLTDHRREANGFHCIFHIMTELVLGPCSGNRRSSFDLKVCLVRKHTSSDHSHFRDQPQANNMLDQHNFFGDRHIAKVAGNESFILYSRQFVSHLHTWIMDVYWRELREAKFEYEGDCTTFEILS